MTEAERKLYRRKVWIFPNGSMKVEPIEDYILRLETTAQLEQRHPRDWWRHLARVLGVIDAPLDQFERDLVSRACKEDWEVSRTEQSILRYRRLTGKNRQQQQPTKE
jgi:hypothetical protein